MTVLLVDGIAFQLPDTSLHQIWNQILNAWAKESKFEKILLLDRGNAPEIDGISNVPFPSYHVEQAAADSALLQQLADHLGADVFTSTNGTTPMTLPMALLLPSVSQVEFDTEGNKKLRAENALAISYATKFVCLSQAVQDELFNRFPETQPNKSRVLPYGVDKDVFKKRTAKSLLSFRKENGLSRDYFIFSGPRLDTDDRKNCSLFFDAVKRMPSAEFDILCLDGAPDLEPEITDGLPKGVSIKRDTLSGTDLSKAFNGAMAFVDPTLNKAATTLPALAMASNCAVVTTARGITGTPAEGTVALVDGESAQELSEVLTTLLDPNERKPLQKAGLKHAASFEWAALADALADQILDAAELAKTDTMVSFYEQWPRLRKIQADIDYH